MRFEEKETNVDWRVQRYWLDEVARDPALGALADFVVLTRAPPDDSDGEAPGPT